MLKAISFCYEDNNTFYVLFLIYNILPRPVLAAATIMCNNLLMMIINITKLIELIFFYNVLMKILLYVIITKL